MDADTEPQKRRLSLAGRIFLAMAALVTLAVGAAVLITWLLGRGIASNAVEDDITRGGAVLGAIQEQRLDQLSLIAELMVGNPYFTAYIAQGLMDGDSFSVTDQLEERIADFGLDFAIVLDPEGAVFADTFTTTAAGLESDPLITELLAEYSIAGIWNRGDELFYVVGAPLATAGVVEGFLLTGEAIDDAAAQELRRVTETEIAYFSGTDSPELVAGTLAVGLADDLERSFRSPSGDRQAVVPVTLGGRSWLALIRPLPGADGAPVGWSVSLGSVAEALAPYVQMGVVLLIVGLLAIAVGALLSGLLTRPVLGPVRELAAAAQKASEGDYDQEIHSRSRDDVGRLASAFSRLLSELREKRDMENYVAELNRSMPPDVTSPAIAPRPTIGTRTEPPRGRRAVTMGVEIRDVPDGRSGEATFEDLQKRLRRVADAVKLQQGQVGTLAGHRLVAVFDGKEPLGRALGAAGVVLADIVLEPAVAIAEGDVVTGAVMLDDLPRPAVTGVAVGRLERLLRTASRGDLLLDQSAFASFEQLAADAGLDPTALPEYHASLPVFSLGRSLAAKLAAVAEADATLAATSAAGFVDSRPAPRRLSGKLEPGSVIANRFEVEGVLGSGGMGVVYRAFDRELDEIVAIKMLKRAASDDAEQVARLRSELKLARKIAHPNVLRLFDFGVVDEVPFISMELVRGITLRQLLERRGRVPVSAGLRLARQLCRGLQAAHGQGVLHRDIKPENLIIEPNGNLKLMDFGIARPVEQHEKGATKTGAIVGTPYYLAPEQLQGEPVDVRTDIYATGIVLYELFTGKLPFADEPTAIKMMMKKTQEDAPLPRTYWPEVPAPLESILVQCVARDPAKRFSKVAELEAALDELRS